MNRLKKFQPKIIIKLFTAECQNNPSLVNKGLCMTWAYLSFLIFDKIELWDIPIHAFVKYKNKFYDSETLNGTMDWRDLPACNFGASFQSAQKRSPVDFQLLWNKNYIKPDWNYYQKIAEQFLIEKYNNEF